jgi:hypothetical protein
VYIAPKPRLQTKVRPPLITPTPLRQETKNLTTTPSARCAFDPLTLTHKVHAVRTIQPGEELTISCTSLYSPFHQTALPLLTLGFQRSYFPFLFPFSRIPRRSKHVTYLYPQNHSSLTQDLSFPSSTPPKQYVADPILFQCTCRHCILPARLVIRSNTLLNRLSTLRKQLLHFSPAEFNR